MKHLASLFLVLFPFSAAALAQDTAVPPAMRSCCSKMT